jgi:hypothetical protein
MVVLLDSCSNRSNPPPTSSPAPAGEDRGGGLNSFNVLNCGFLLQAGASLSVPEV